jgi:hypothetical protein
MPWVAVIRQGDLIEAVLPFEYRDRLRKWIGLGEPIGGHPSDASGGIVGSGWRTSGLESETLSLSAAPPVHRAPRLTTSC